MGQQQCHNAAKSVKLGQTVIASARCGLQLGFSTDRRILRFSRGMDAHNIGFETENGGRTITGTTRRVHFFSRGELDKMTTAEVSDSLERVDNIINVLDEIMDHMDGFSSAEEAWLSSITETLRTWRYVMQETYESPEGNKDD
jgi:hypothetical protein